MEILSVGEKIKRARIYKGLTLKDICDGRISVSKMSCIENGKVKPEDWIIHFIAEKLELSIEYLKQDVDYQIEYNIENECKNCEAQEKEKNLKYNLQYAEQYKYYDLAFQLRHLLFKYYIDKNDAKACLADAPGYYEILIKSSKNENKNTYYIDIGRYFCLIKEYAQAVNYFSIVRYDFENNKLKNYDKIFLVAYEEAKCYYMLNDYEKAINIADKFIGLESYLDKDKYKAKLYGLLGVFSIKMNNGEFNKYEKMSYEFSGDNLSIRAEIMYNYGKAFLEQKLEKQAYFYIKKVIGILPTDDIRGYIQVMLNIIEILIKMNKQKKAEELNDNVLNYAINMQENMYIEKAYYFKALLMSKSKDNTMQEMYMNLSLDLLLKYGSKEQIYKRYMEMGNMYFKMKNVQESLKYFGLALGLTNNI